MGIALMLACSYAVAQDNDEDELALAYGGKASISIATGSRQTLMRAPAVASVITAEDIQAMGAIDLDQVLNSVPGLHVSVLPISYRPIYSFRGIYSSFNPEVLMLVNGMPITTVFTGNRGEAWGGFPLENVARIEVLRGPGSALYGADAYAGVINVITKTAADIQGTQYGVRGGSFRTGDAWVQHGGRLGPLEAAFFLRAGHTDGHRPIIAQDLQSAIDSVFGTHASLSPGPANTLRNAFDARMDLALDAWRLRAGYQQRELGMGAGLADSLDPNGRIAETRRYADLTYHDANWAPNWDVTALAGYFDVRNNPGDPAYMLFPAGAFGGAFPAGVIGNPGHAERHASASLNAFYSGIKNHRLRVGSGFQSDDLYATQEFKNFNLVSVPGVGTIFVPLPGLVDATGTPLVFLQPHKRHVTYVFVQDEWMLAQDWTLTAGLRHDRYSDFGGTTNPRLALVWDAAYNVVVKALHGRAFRAPSFTELYNQNNPVAVGNPGLRPETIATNELVVSWQPTQNLQTSLTLFSYRTRDLIRYVANVDPTTGNTAQNAGDQTGRGLELEATWDASRALRLSGNISLQRSIDETTGQDAGLAPHRKLFARADWRFAPRWQFGAIVNHVADRKRQPGDNRPQIADYATLDLTLRREKIAGNWEMRATVQNLFNRDAREPTFAPGNIPFDLPLAGRVFYLQFQHSL